VIGTARRDREHRLSALADENRNGTRQNRTGVP